MRKKLQYIRYYKTIIIIIITLIKDSKYITRYWERLEGNTYIQTIDFWVLCDSAVNENPLETDNIDAGV